MTFRQFMVLFLVGFAAIFAWALLVRADSGSPAATSFLVDVSGIWLVLGGLTLIFCTRPSSD